MRTVPEILGWIAAEAGTQELDFGPPSGERIRLLGAVLVAIGVAIVAASLLAARMLSARRYSPRRRR